MAKFENSIITKLSLKLSIFPKITMPKKKKKVNLEYISDVQAFDYGEFMTTSYKTCYSF